MSADPVSVPVMKTEKPSKRFKYKIHRLDTFEVYDVGEVFVRNWIRTELSCDDPVKRLGKYQQDAVDSYPEAMRAGAVKGGSFLEIKEIR